MLNILNQQILIRTIELYFLQSSIYLDLDEFILFLNPFTQIFKSS